jgi:hypothetical protein
VPSYSRQRCFEVTLERTANVLEFTRGGTTLHEEALVMVHTEKISWHGNLFKVTILDFWQGSTKKFLHIARVTASVRWVERYQRFAKPAWRFAASRSRLE